MLDITLYKGCRFNASYINVMAGSIYENGNPVSFLSKYLSTLGTFDLHLDTVYYENAGELVFDLYPLNNIYEYNYMKVVMTDALSRKITRYCFINSISIKNGCVYLSYEEDVWHSYLSEIIGINNSYLSNSRLKSYTNLIPSIIEIPVNYDGNNKLEYQSISFPSEQYTRDIYCICQLQTYDLVNATDRERDNRSVSYIMIKIGNNNFWYNNPGMAEDVIQNLMLHMYNGKADGHSYEIGNIYFIPKNLVKEADFINARLFTYKENEGTPAETTITICQYKTLVLLYNYSTILTGTISNNYKNIALGTFNSKIDLINNGTNIDYSITLYETDAGISLLLNCQNEIIDIIDDFKYDIPFTSMLAEEYSQRQIAVGLQGIKNFYAQDTMQVTGITGIGNLMFDLLGVGAQGMFYSQYATKAGNMVSAGNSILSHGFDTGYSFTNGKYVLEAEQDAIYAPKYSNTKSVRSNHSNAVNIREGLVLFKVNSDNDNYVKGYINNYGYKVYEFLTDYSKLEINKMYYTRPVFNYNVLKFTFIDIYGKFPREIAVKLNQIFTNGVKIWYNENFADDNYVI